MFYREIRLRNDLSILAIIVSSLQLILIERTDRAVRCGHSRELDDSELARVHAMLKKIQALAEKVSAEISSRTVPILVSEICGCPIHLECLRRVKITTVMELHDADPFLLKEMIDEAEKKSTEAPQYQLYSSLKFRTRQIAESTEQDYRKEEK